MTQQHRNNYFKLVSLIVDVAYLVISKYIKEKILGPDSFETFLNKEKHKLVHIYETSQCCECRSVSINGERLITKKQLLMLFKSDDRNLIRDHRKYAGNKLIQICICKYSAKENIDVRVVDITLANYIIQKCGKQELGIDNWIKEIKDVRNKIFHLSDTKEMTDHIFSNKWTKLERSIMGIAKEISSDYADEAEKLIMQTQKLTIIGDYMLKYEIICRDYWRNKCAEFERAQNQVIEEKAAALHHTMPKLFRRSMEKECHQTMRKIQTLNSMVNMINIMVNIFGSEENVELFDDTELVMEDNKRILIPVFMQLDIPTSWDKTKVFEAIDKLRLTGTEDMNIRIKAISIDDLNMYAEIAKQVLGNVHELRSEINKLMSTMLSDAEIDTMESAELCVNLNVPDRSAPRKFDIVECTDCSITIEWSIDVPDECLSYELDHRPQGTNDWSVRTFYHEDVLKGEDEQRKYQLQNLVPETYYECKLRSVCNHVKSNFSESLTKQTLIQEVQAPPDVPCYNPLITQAPRRFDIVECTDCSITIEWFIDVQDECLSYELDHRPPQGSDNLPVRTFSSKDVEQGDNGRRMYTLQNLLPETYYELKLRSVYKDAKSHYSESKTKQTLKLAPRQFDIGECTDCSMIIEWYINDQDDCLSYEIAHRPQRTKDWSTGTILSKDVLKEEDGRRMYTLRNLLPQTYYEFKLRSVYKDAKSHYSESKTKQTLRLENEPNKEVQDQTSVKTNLPVSVILRQQLNIKNSKNENPMTYTCSCIKTGNTLVFTDYTNGQLIICNSDGSDIDHIPLSNTPWYITGIDSNTVAVSCVFGSTILIINISTRSIKSKIKTNGICGGISYNDNNLYVVIDWSITHVMDLTGKVIRTIPLPTDGIDDITVDRDRLVCIENTSIYCCSLDGKLMWKFKNDTFQDLRHVTTDNEGNVYVTKEKTHRHAVLVVSEDGKHQRELLTESDGLDRPWGIYFDKKENTLLVCNFIGKANAFLFDVKHKLT